MSKLGVTLFWLGSVVVWAAVLWRARTIAGWYEGAASRLRQHIPEADQPPTPRRKALETTFLKWILRGFAGVALLLSLLALWVVRFSE